jgi:hypothetical protein
MVSKHSSSLKFIKFQLIFCLILERLAIQIQINDFDRDNNLHSLMNKDFFSVFSDDLSILK